MTRMVLYSYPVVVACLFYIAISWSLTVYQHSSSPDGYCTVSGEELQEPERQAIAQAKRFIELTQMGNAWELDGRFRVQADGEGYQVHVLFVSGYSMSGRPIFIPGGHCTVNVSQDGQAEYAEAPGRSTTAAIRYRGHSSSSKG